MTFAPELRVTCLCAEWCTSCREYRSGFDGLAAGLPHLRHVVVLESAAGTNPAGVAGEYEELLARAADDFPFREFE